MAVDRVVPMAADHPVAVPLVAARRVVAQPPAMVVAEQAAVDRVAPTAAAHPVAAPVVAARRVVAQPPAMAVAE
jgi:hypothetical protein